MIIARKPSREPTDRSMLRETMTSTMPVAMIATVEVCTDRFQRLRGVRNTPPDMMWKPIQTIRSAAIMPSMRASISVACMKARTRPTRLVATLVGAGPVMPEASAMSIRHEKSPQRA